MCGINGIINSARSRQELTDLIDSMNGVVRNRGPDGQGIFLDDFCAIGHTRLAIVDSKNRTADQPMKSGDYIITFNGEIYNYKKLRNELKENGINFKTNCDTEVLLEGFKLWGEKILDKINGQFAFSVYNVKTREIFLARDRTAMKPLYFSLQEGFQFSSDPRSIVRNIGFEPNIDSIVSLLINGSVFAAGEEPLGDSIYKGIYSLKPGEYMKILSDGAMFRHNYYSLPIKDLQVSKLKEDYVYDLRNVLESAIINRIPEEVTLGCALSGGLDSSIVAAVAADNYNGNIIASCIRYTADGSNPDYEAAKLLANSRQNIELVSADISPECFLDDLEEMVAVLGIQDSIRQLAMYKNYKVLRHNGVKVVLTGEGADEFNWGYWYNFPGLKSDQEVCSDQKRLKELILSRQEYVSKLINPQKLEEINFDKSFDYLLDIYASFDTNDSKRRMMGVYAVDFLGFLNKANDRCAMANSIEVRCPFQDLDVIATCVEIPQEYQISNGTEKYILREAFKDRLPEQIYNRPKAPLPAASHIDYHKVIAREFINRIHFVNDSFWNYFNKDSFEKIANNYIRRINELEHDFSAEDAGVKLMEWRPISSSCNIVDGDDIRTNDVFKLLTTLVWYNQNIAGGYEHE
ncbi:MAG: asparagine synthase (glutamine-hydrolyzing) [Candidatus Woesearchaeota archaeon]